MTVPSLVAYQILRVLHAGGVTEGPEPKRLATPWQHLEQWPFWGLQSQAGIVDRQDGLERFAAQSGPLARPGTGRCHSAGCRSASQHVSSVNLGLNASLPWPIIDVFRYLVTPLPTKALACGQQLEPAAMPASPWPHMPDAEWFA